MVPIVLERFQCIFILKSKLSGSSKLKVKNIFSLKFLVTLIISKGSANVLPQVNYQKRNNIHDTARLILSKTFYLKIS